VASAVGEGSVAVQLLHNLFAADRLHPRGRPRGGLPRPVTATRAATGTARSATT
jgi:thioredoxin reductase (NADPH)